jgi:hypothetical protein
MLDSGSDNPSPALIADASLRIGRLAAAAQRSPLYPLWVSHETGNAVASLFSRGAAPIEPWELMALAAGLPGKRTSIEDNAARRFWVRARRLWATPVCDEPVSNVPEITKELHDLQAEGLPPGDLALEAPLRLAKASCIPLPCGAAALPPGEADQWQTAHLASLSQAAAESHERLVRLERDFARWQSLLPPIRGDSRLRETLVLLGTTYSLTPGFVAETLGVTRQAAARLLRQLEELGVVQQMARRQRWLVYLARNPGAPMIPESTTRHRGENPMPIDMSAMDEVLDQAYAAIDRSVRREDAS